MKKLLLFAFIFMGMFIAFGRCNNANPGPDPQPNKLNAPDSVKVTDTTIVDSAQIRKTGK